MTVSEPVMTDLSVSPHVPTLKPPRHSLVAEPIYMHCHLSLFWLMQYPVLEISPVHHLLEDTLDNHISKCLTFEKPFPQTPSIRFHVFFLWSYSTLFRLQSRTDLESTPHPLRHALALPCTNSVTRGSTSLRPS